MKSTYKPVLFFILAFAFAWIPGFSAAYLSYQQDMQALQRLLIFPILLAPFTAASIMLSGSKNKALRRDFWDRFQWCRIRGNFIPILFLFMPLVLFLATAISLLFGYSISQFSLSENQFQVMHGQALTSIMLLLLAPLFEELGWRGYGVDSLRSRFSLFNTSLLFGLLWGLYHLPFFFMNGYYHHELWETSMIYTANFFVSIIPASFLMNWIYYKNHRSISAAILFHFMINLFSVLFQTEQFTKCIITVLFLLISALVIITNKEFFFGKQRNWFSN